MPATTLHACEYMIVRLAPDPLRNETVNIGVALFDPAPGGFSDVRITPDWERVRRLHPLFDPADLAGLEADLRTRLRTESPPWAGREYFVQLAQETFSHSLQLSPPTLVLTADPAAELERLYQQYAAPLRPAARLAVTGVRRGMLQQLDRVWKQERIFDRLERRVGISTWLGQPDSFRFDYHYKPNGLAHVLQAVPLAVADASVKELCFTVERVRARLGGLDAAGFVDAIPALPEQRDLHQYHRGLLAAAGIRVLEMAQAAEEAARVRSALGIH